MGCGSSREARSDPQDVPTSVVPSIRSTNPAGITSQTAINTPLTPTTYRRDHTFAPGASASNLSTPRTSTTGHLHQDGRDIDLTQHYNAPLIAPKAWTSREREWTRTQLHREREDFFETRVTGRSEIWAALKEICELVRHGDLTEAQGIIDAAGITLPTGLLDQGAYDERGMAYKLPEHIVSDPLNLVDDDGETIHGDDTLSKKIEAGGMTMTAPLASNEVISEKVDKGKDAIEKDAMKVRCRLSDRGGPDTIVLLGQSQPVSVLLRRLRAEATIASSARVRVVYFGKILEESQTLEEQGWQQGHVVQALVSNFAP